MTQYYFLWVIYAYDPWCQYEDSSKCLPPTPTALPGFRYVCLLFYKKCLINLFLPWSCYLQNIMNFQKKEIRVFILGHCWSVLILLYCFVYKFFTFFFHSSVIMKSRIKSFCCFPVSDGKWQTDVGNEEIDLREKNFLSWQNIWSSR